MNFGRPSACFKVFSFSLAILLATSFRAPLWAQNDSPKPGLSDNELLETIQRRAFDYFLNEHSTETGLVADRAANFENVQTSGHASIASTGFALAAYAVGVKHNWLDYGTAHEMTYRTLKFLWEAAPQEHGFFYHFMNRDTGKRLNKSEISPIDTALLLAGVLFAAEFYEDVRIRELAVAIYERVDWPWLLRGGQTLVMSWSPEEGFNKRRWENYDESMIMYLLAIGSPTHPIPAASWQAIARPVGSYKNYRLIQQPPLFTHQYSHVWVDFRNKNDGHADYFKNSVNATLAQRAFAIDQSSKFRSYGPNSWGLTASDGPFGYRAYGAPPGWAEHDGTVAPTACGSSIVFTPKESMACLRYFYEGLGDKIWGRYGFADAFNLDRDWHSKEVIGIDQGPLLLMIENYRTGLIWDTMGKNLALQNAMRAVGFKNGSMELSEPKPPEIRADYVFGGILVDGYMKDWPSGEVLKLDLSNKEVGNIKDEKDLSGQVRFAWDEQWLYFFTKVRDDDLIVRKTRQNIWQDDMFELFIDPDGDGFNWNDPKDFQIGFRSRLGTSSSERSSGAESIGFRPHIEDDGVEAWSWFQGGVDPTAQAQAMAKSFVEPGGYQIEGAIRWKFLGMEPRPGAAIKLSAALHDIDRDRSEGKLQWFFKNEGDARRFLLGTLVLKANARQ